MIIEYHEYITKEGDRWDLISYEYYGDPHKYEEIIKANPSVPIMPVLESGIKLKIPIISTKETIGEALTPPWKK